MATFQCPDCKNKVSDKAEACPKCGRKFTTEEIKKLMSDEKKSGYIGCGLLIVIILVVYFFFFGGDDATETSSEPSQNNQIASEQSESEQVEEIGLKMTPTELMNKINDFASESDVSLRLSNLVKVDGNATDVNDVYQADFSDESILQATTKKNDKNIINIMLISVLKSDTGVFDLIVAYGCLIAALNPELDANGRGELITELMQDSTGKLNSEKTTTRGNIKYTFSASEITGVVLIAGNTQD